MARSPLADRRIVITRPDLGPLGDMLLAVGAEVIHMPLIEMIDPQDSGAALNQALADCAPGDWLVVTSPEGARRVVAVGEQTLGRKGSDRIRIAAVGRATAAVVEAVSAEPVDLVPQIQRASELAEAFKGCAPGQRMLVAHGDLADSSLVSALRAQGHQVTAVVAYRTVGRSPSDHQRRAANAADAVVLASGSAARSWAKHCADIHPPVVCAIGPSTATVAAEVGLIVTHQAAASSVEGIMVCLNQAFDPAHPTMG